MFSLPIAKRGGGSRRAGGKGISSVGTLGSPIYFSRNDSVTPPPTPSRKREGTIAQARPLVGETTISESRVLTCAEVP